MSKAALAAAFLTGAVGGASGISLAADDAYVESVLSKALSDAEQAAFEACVATVFPNISVLGQNYTVSAGIGTLAVRGVVSKPAADAAADAKAGVGVIVPDSSVIQARVKPAK